MEENSDLLQHDSSYIEKGYYPLAGVDEAGCGPLAGPVVASAVIVRDFSFSSKIRDSKKLTARMRLQAYGEISEKCSVGLSIVSHESIDEVNIFQATMLAMKQAVEKLPEPPACVLVDGPRPPKLSVKHFAIVDGDAKSFSIACASIVAKVTRDRIMEEYNEHYPQYGFDRHKGYGTRQHLEALNVHGPCPIHRRSYAPVKNAMGE